MAFQIKIINNDTGETVADYEAAKGFMGVICGGKQMQRVSCWGATIVEVAQMVETLQNIIIQTTEENPKVVEAGEALALFRKLRGFGDGD